MCTVSTPLWHRGGSVDSNPVQHTFRVAAHNAGAALVQTAKTCPAHSCCHDRTHPVAPPPYLRISLGHAGLQQLLLGVEGRGEQQELLCLGPEQRLLDAALAQQDLRVPRGLRDGEVEGQGP
jgi:hypothetical protein